MSATTEANLRAISPQTDQLSAQALQAAKLTVLYRESDSFYVVSLICALLCVLLLWGQVPPLALVLWLAAYGILALGGIRLNKHFHRNEAAHQQPGRWRNLFLLGALLTGSGWGLLGSWLPLQQGALPVGLVLSVSAGLCIYAISLYSASLRVSLAFVLPATVPTLWAQLARQELIYTPLIPIFVLFLVFSSLRIRHFIRDTLTLSLRNQQLIEHLAQQKQQADILNQELNQEIAQRRQAQEALQQSQQHLEDLVRERTLALSEANQRLHAEIHRRRLASEELERSRTRLSQAIEASSLGLWDWDLVTDKIYHSHFEQLFGYHENEIPHFMGHLQPLVHPDDYPQLRQAIVATLKGQTPQYRQQFRIKHKSGIWRWLEDVGQVIERDPDGRALRMLGTRRDITEERRKNEQLRLAWTVFDSSEEAIFVLDQHYRILSINKAFSQLTGYAAAEVFNRPFKALNPDPEAQRQYRQISALLQRQGFWEGEVSERRKNGEPYLQRLKIYLVRDEQQQFLHYVGLFSDITEQKQREERLSYLANYDELTGLANRTLLTDHLHQAITEARRHNHLLALIHVDLDRFKPINNTLGHAIGDQLLRAAAERLTAAVHEADTIARLAGDEFMLLLDNIDSRPQISAVAERIIETLRRPFNINGHELLISASLGISIFPYHGRELQLLLNQADLARNKAKQEGGNRYHYYTPDLQSGSLARLSIEHDLRKAIQRHEFDVFYQPKLCLHNHRITDAEALVRWRHPEKGLIAPGEFIPIAEETGLIGAIGEQVLMQACNQAKRWYDGGHPLKVSVNLSAQQVRQGDLIASVRQALEHSGLAVNYLELELTESLLMEDAEQTVRKLQQLREMGVTISIDDFGTGYSSLSYLRRFPIDTLKIDRSFIDEIEDDEHGGTITKAVIAMGHSLNMQVVAEGVETQAQLAFLSQQGCDAAQGYYISRPLPAPDFTALLQQKNHSPQES